MRGLDWGTVEIPDDMWDMAVQLDRMTEPKILVRGEVEGNVEDSVYPDLSAKSIGGCSSFNASKVYIKNIVEQNEDVVFYFAYPDREDIDVEGLSISTD